MSIQDKRVTVNARSIKIGHLKNRLIPEIDKFEGIVQSIFLRLGDLGVNKALFNRISLSLALLSDLGITVTIGKGDVTFSLPGRELTFEIPNNSASLSNLLQLTLSGASWGFEVIPSGYSPLSNKFVTIEREIMKIYDGSTFYLADVDPWVITETYFLKTHDNFCFGGKVVLDVGAAFGDTAVRFAKAGATGIAVEPANFDQLIRNLNLNDIGSGKVIPLNVAAGIDGSVEIEVVSGSSFDGNARISGVNTKHSNKRIKVPGMSIKNIIGKAGLDSVDYLKSDCKGCESYFSKDDFDLIREGVEIECDVNNSEFVLKALKSSGFETCMWHYNGANYESLRDVGTIVARRKGRE